MRTEAQILKEELEREKREESAGMYTKQYARGLKREFKGRKFNGKTLALGNKKK